jgi:drug/metabolite transporter (DMT)-like permease
MTSTGSPTDRRLERVIGMALVNLATFTWATNMTLGRWLRDSVGPITLSASRFSIAALLFAALLQRRPAEERRPEGDGWLLLGMALSGVAVFAPLLYLGLRFTTAVNATLLNGLGPLITGLLAALLIREPMSRPQVVGAIVGLGGVMAVISGGSPSFWGSLHGDIGDLIVLGAVTLWGLYSVLGRQVMRHRSALSATALSTFLGLPFLCLAAAWELRAFPIHWRPEVALAMVYIGVAPAVIGFLSWNEGVRRLGPSGAMVFYNTLPLYGALLGRVFLREPIGLGHWLGGALIIGGGLWAARARPAGPESG